LAKKIRDLSTTCVNSACSNRRSRKDKCGDSTPKSAGRIMEIRIMDRRMIKKNGQNNNLNREQDLILLD